MKICDDLLALKAAVLERLPARVESVLYVGAQAHPTRKPSFLVQLKLRAARVDCLEAWGPNADFQRSLKRRFDRVIDGRVESFDVSGYDLRFFWHGPEHLLLPDGIRLLVDWSAREGMAVVACPWGPVPQGARGGNPWEIHKSYYDPDDLEHLGYDVLVLGRRGRRGSTIVGISSVGR